MATHASPADADVWTAKRFKTMDEEERDDRKREVEQKIKSQINATQVENEIRRTKERLLDRLRENTYSRDREVVGVDYFDSAAETYKRAAWRVEQIKSVGVEFYHPSIAFQMMIDAFTEDGDGRNDTDHLQKIKDEIKIIESKHPEAKTICIRWREEAKENADAESDESADNWLWKFNQGDIAVTTMAEVNDSNIYPPTTRIEVEGKSGHYIDFAWNGGVDFDTIVRTVTFDIDELKKLLMDHDS